MAEAKGAGAALAADQQGRTSTEQLLAVGLDGHRRRRLERQGLLVPCRAGVWAWGAAAPSRHADLREATLAGGTSAVAIRSSARWLWGWEADPPEHHVVSIARGARRKVPGIVFCERRAPLPEEDVTEHFGLPVTTPARTVVDSAADHRGAELDRLVHTALVSDYLQLGALTEAVSRAGGVTGIGELRAIVLEAQDSGRLRSAAEHDLRRLVGAAGLGEGARFNHPVHGRERDCVWPELKLVVEVISFAFHGTPSALDGDLRRDAELQAAGWHVHPVSARMLRTDVVRTMAQLGQVVGRLRALAAEAAEAAA